MLLKIPCSLFSSLEDTKLVLDIPSQFELRLSASVCPHLHFLKKSPLFTKLDINIMFFEDTSTAYLSITYNRQ
jgi:hypothetical protein